MVDYNRTIELENVTAEVSHTEFPEPTSGIGNNYYLLDVMHDGTKYQSVIGHNSMFPLRSGPLKVGDKITGKFQYRPVGEASWFQPYAFGLQRS